MRTASQWKCSRSRKSRDDRDGLQEFFTWRKREKWQGWPIGMQIETVAKVIRCTRGAPLQPSSIVSFSPWVSRVANNSLPIYGCSKGRNLAVLPRLWFHSSAISPLERTGGFYKPNLNILPFSLWMLNNPPRMTIGIERIESEEGRVMRIGVSVDGRDRGFRRRGYGRTPLEWICPGEKWFI